MAVDKGAHVVPRNQAMGSLQKLREPIAIRSDPVPVLSRFYFTHTAGD